MQSQTVFDRIKAKRDECSKLYAQLEMWAKVKMQGISPDDVVSFGFDPKLLTVHELRLARSAAIRHARHFIPSNPLNFPTTKVDGIERAKPLLYNYVNLKSGERHELNPRIAAPQ